MINGKGKKHIKKNKMQIEKKKLYAGKFLLIMASSFLLLICGGFPVSSDFYIISSFANCPVFAAEREDNVSEKQDEELSLKADTFTSEGAKELFLSKSLLFVVWDPFLSAKPDELLSEEYDEDSSVKSNECSSVESDESRPEETDFYAYPDSECSESTETESVDIMETEVEEIKVDTSAAVKTLSHITGSQTIRTWDSTRNTSEDNDQTEDDTFSDRYSDSNQKENDVLFTDAPNDNDREGDSTYSDENTNNDPEENGSYSDENTSNYPEENGSYSDENTNNYPEENGKFSDASMDNEQVGNDSLSDESMDCEQVGNDSLSDESMDTEQAGDFSLSDETLQNIQDALDAYDGIEVEFTMVDLVSGQAISYNADTTMYSASAIKGPYIISLLSSGIPKDENMYYAIKYSDNYAYETCVDTYGKDIFTEWLTACDAENTTWCGRYADTTSLDLAKMWTCAYDFLTSDMDTASWVSEVFQETNCSAISQALRQYTVCSKAGWIDEGDYYYVYTNAGIVFDGNHPYVIAIMSRSAGTEGIPNAEKLAEALDIAHWEMIGRDTSEYVSANNQEVTYQVYVRRLKVLKGPEKTTPCLGALPEGTEVKVLEISENYWGKIEYDGNVGWICLTYCKKK